VIIQEKLIENYIVIAMFLLYEHSGETHSKIIAEIQE